MKKKKVGKVCGVRPTGTLILVEKLKADETLGTSLIINEDTEVPSPQGYVIAVGPAINEKENHWGIKVGDRVLLQGSYVPVPKFKDGRELGLVEIHTIKAILEEE